MSIEYLKQINAERNLLDFSYPADYETITFFIEKMADRYPFIKVTGIGESVFSRKLHMITLGDENAEKSVLYVGTHHGTEWITTLVLLRFVNEYCEYFKNKKQPFGVNMQTLFSTRCLRVVPCLNPDGAELQINGIRSDNVIYDRLMKMSGGDFTKWNANARGVDLNHNYDAGFAEYKLLERRDKIFPGKSRYSGEYPLSEPETAALASYIRYDRKLGMIITLHSAGEEIYYSSDGYVPKGVESIAKKLSVMSGYKLSEAEGLSAYGGLTDWFIKEYDKPSFTIECGNGENPIHEKNYYSIYAKIREMLLWAPLLI